MSKLINQKLINSLIPKHIEVSLSKEVKINEPTSNTKIDEYYKRFNVTTNTVISKIKGIFSVTCDWLEDIKEVQNSSEPLETNYIYLKIWKLLVEMENLKSGNQFKLIVARFRKDIKASYLIILYINMHINRYNTVNYIFSIIIILQLSKLIIFYEL